MTGKPVSGGQRIGGNLSATDWNSVRARNDRLAVRDAGFIAGEGVDDAVDGIATIKNNTGLYLVPGSVVGLAAPSILPSQNLREFKSSVQFTGVIPTEAHAGRFGILLDGCAPDRFAPATVHGLAWANLEMQSATDVYADVDPNNTNTLKSGSSGAAQILYHFPASATYPQQTLGYVRLSNKQGSNALSPIWLKQVYPVRATDGGAVPYTSSQEFRSNVSCGLYYRDIQGDLAANKLEWLATTDTVDGDTWGKPILRVLEAGSYLISINTAFEKLAYSGNTSWNSGTSPTNWTVRQTTLEDGHVHDYLTPVMQNGSVSTIVAARAGPSGSWTSLEIGGNFKVWAYEQTNASVQGIASAGLVSLPANAELRHIVQLTNTNISGTIAMACTHSRFYIMRIGEFQQADFNWLGVSATLPNPPNPSTSHP